MKQCIYENCRNNVFSNGFCKNHSYLIPKKVKREPVDRGLFKRQTEVEPIDEKLVFWFEYHMKYSNRYCENCGKSLSTLSEWEWRGSQHHVLEKSIFESVRSEIKNHMVLGYYCCHQQFHSSMLNASKMPCFGKAKEIVISLIPLLTDEEKGRISPYYKIEI